MSRAPTDWELAAAKAVYNVGSMKWDDFMAKASPQQAEMLREIWVDRVRVIVSLLRDPPQEALKQMNIVRYSELVPPTIAIWHAGIDNISPKEQ